MNPPCRLDRILLGLALAALTTLPACGTKELSPKQVLAGPDAQPTASQGTLGIYFAHPEETYAELQTAPTQVLIHVLADGKDLVSSHEYLYTVVPGEFLIAGNYEAGIHHFAIAQVGGGTLFEGDGPIDSGQTTRLYVFGPLDALQGRFVTYPFKPPDGSIHITAINLVRSGGVEIEVVTCTDPTTCTPISPALSLGETFDANLPVSNTPTSGMQPVPTTGGSFGYRRVATASLPAPPIQPLAQALLIPLTLPYATPIYAVTPEYMGDDGRTLMSAD